ncbi:piggyBac transposable element-derived protein 3 [Eurytemora carolleeae]|uniref:piggyBac transposable element-derived protein 3 n=1 Tax=Eurytemora carolleeae TaxID=1294199 RepID=UPI000C769D6B|nr:piggyBac transposable element-derived protein 3 [Eurytemora carolleeae]|eukprot:XP_023348132.1 piggyBac transposable element-derived protein 3-like [Eurytemora affinis]
MASNKYSAERTNTVGCFCRTERKKIQIPIPEMIEAYNQNMGGVDLLDNMVACYRVPYRKKKWWFNIYVWSLSISAVNAWRLRNRITGNKEPYLNFLQELVIQMFSKYGTMPQRTRFSSGPTNGLRYDGLNHWIVSTESNSQGKSSRRNCKHCTNEGKRDSKTLLKCEKCMVPLHQHYFKDYHMN